MQEIFLQVKEDKNMKQIIRLTESDLHRIVKESVQNILQEMKPDDFKNSFSPYFHLNKRSNKPISPKRAKKPIEIEEELGSGSSGGGFAGGSVTPGASSDSEDRNGQVLKGSGVVRRKGFMDDALDHKNMIKKGFEGQ